MLFVCVCLFVCLFVCLTLFSKGLTHKHKQGLLCANVKPNENTQITNVCVCICVTKYIYTVL